MSIKIEEMTETQLEEELNKIIKVFRIEVCPGETAISQDDIDRLEMIFKQMRDLERKRASKTIKEKVESTIGGFLERNNQYTIETYISNGVANNRIGQITIATDRIFKTDDNKFTLEWDVDGKEKCNMFSFQYDEIMDCYVDHDIEYVAQTAVVLMKNGVKVDFVCCGL